MAGLTNSGFSYSEKSFCAKFECFCGFFHPANPVFWMYASLIEERSLLRQLRKRYRVNLKSSFLDFSHLKLFSQIVCAVLRMLWLWVSFVFLAVSKGRYRAATRQQNITIHHNFKCKQKYIKRTAWRSLSKIHASWGGWIWHSWVQSFHGTCQTIAVSLFVKSETAILCL